MMKKNHTSLRPLLVIAGVFVIILSAYFLFLKPSPDASAHKLAAQGIETNPEGFIQQIEAGNADNVKLFIQLGATPDVTNAAGRNALVAAAGSGNIDVLHYLLKALSSSTQQASALLNAQDTKGDTAATLAASLGHTDIVKALFDKGADSVSTNKQGATPLLAALDNKQYPTAQLILDEDKARNKTALSINLPKNSGETPLITAINAKNVEWVKILLDAGADVINADLSGNTPLMFAAIAGNKDIVELLIDKTAKLDINNKQGQTPLGLAISHQHYDLAKLLLEKGANPDLSAIGKHPLELVISINPFNKEFFDFLLERSKRAKERSSALLLAAIENKRTEIFTTLLSYGLNPNASLEGGATLLYHAIQTEQEDLALLLLDKGANPLSSGVTGMTNLERAAKNNMVKTLAALLEKGASPEQKSTEGYTLAEMAVYKGFPDVLDVLLKAGAKIDKDFGVLWSIRDGKGKAVPVLLKHGAKANIMNENGDPALWLAASLGQYDAVNALLEQKAAIEYPNRNQSMTALIVAAQFGRLDTVKLLLEKGANIEARDAAGMTALAHAAFNSQVEAVEYLLQKGANPRALDRQQRSPADLAGLANPSEARDKVLTLLRAKTLGETVDKEE